jgi:hypothetical protein
MHTGKKSFVISFKSSALFILMPFSLFILLPMQGKSNPKLKNVHQRVFEAENRHLCRDCHHFFKPGYQMPPGVKPTTMRCSNCHRFDGTKREYISDMLPMLKELHLKCKNCHEKYNRPQVANHIIGALVSGTCKKCH